MFNLFLSIFVQFLQFVLYYTIHKHHTYTNIEIHYFSTLSGWAECDSNCRSEVYMENAKYNLASAEHSELWTEDIFSFESLSSGHCHTYNPVNNSVAGNRGQFYAMLGKESYLIRFYLMANV